jgi:hypothetical protein
VLRPKHTFADLSISAHTLRRAPSLSERLSERLSGSVLGDDLLNFWVDACEGESPLQYLFMGRANTATNMHSDLGGLGVIIAPILGEKEVTMVHRDDSSIVYDCRLDPLKPDLDKFPLFAYARVWRHTLQVGVGKNTTGITGRLERAAGEGRNYVECNNLPVQCCINAACMLLLCVSVCVMLRV